MKNIHLANWHVERHQRFTPHEVGGPGGSFEGVNTWFNLIVDEDPKDPKLRTPIAEVTVSTEMDDHAKLIAASPRLLNGLKEAVEWLRSLGYGRTPQAQEFREIIAQAEGK